jgi:hypothetical protein
MGKIPFLMLLSAILCCVAAFVSAKLVKAEIRLQIHDERDYLELLDSSRNSALQSGPGDAVVFLYKNQTPISASWPNITAPIAELERKRAVRDVIQYLRVKTGKDLGDNPVAWIQAFGSDQLKANQNAMSAP